jgi:hypothetical protein
LGEPRRMKSSAYVAILRDAASRLLRGWECFVFDGLQDTDRCFSAEPTSE